jgi:AraC family transcriptional regulator
MDRWYLPGSRLPPHRHATANLCLVLTGGFDEFVAPGPRRCNSAALLYRSATETHAQVFNRSGAWCVTIEPPHDWLPETALAAPGTAGLHGWPAVLALRLYAALWQARCPTPALEPLAVELCAAAKRRLMPRRHRLPAWFLEAEHRLNHGFRGPLRLTDMARAVGVHRVHLTRAFRRVHGQAPKDYVRYLRIHAACHAILEGHGSLSRTASDLGFSDQSHFTRTFRSTLGLSPRRFRELFIARQERARQASTSQPQGAA